MASDVCIIGAGPAGLSAAIYLIRSGYSVELFECSAPGGKVNLTASVENYPGIEQISGPDLAMQLYQHAYDLGAKIKSARVLRVQKNGDEFEVETAKEVFKYKAVIIASGTKENELDVEGAKEFTNKGVSYCAVCDGRFYKDQPVAVIGGGDSALEEALYLEKICSKVYLVHRRQEFRGASFLVDKVKASSIELVLDSVPTKVDGDTKVGGLVVKNAKTEEISKLDVKAIFPYLGAKPNTSFIVNQEILNDKGYIKVDNNMSTSIKGLYAVGDVVEKSLRQIVTAASDGAIAGIEVANYLKNI